MRCALKFYSKAVYALLVMSIGSLYGGDYTGISYQSTKKPVVQPVTEISVDKLTEPTHPDHDYYWDLQLVASKLYNERFIVSEGSKTVCLQRSNSEYMSSLLKTIGESIFLSDKHIHISQKSKSTAIKALK